MGKKLSAAAQLIAVKLYTGGMATYTFAHSLHCMTVVIDQGLQ